MTSVDRTRRFFDDRPDGSPTRSWFHYARGVVAKLAGDYPAAAGHFERALREGDLSWEVFEESLPYFRTKAELLRAIDLLQERLAAGVDPALCHQGLGYLHFWLDSYGPSERHYSEALALLKAEGRTAAVAGCLFHQAYLFMYLNQYDLARDAIDLCLRAAREAGDRTGEIKALELLSFIRLDQGDYRGALDLCLDALRGAQALGDPDLEATCLRTLGVARMETGDLVAAAEGLNKAAAWFARLGEERRLGVVLYWQSLLYKQQGDFSRALLTARRGLAISQREGFRTAEAFHLSAIGDFYHALGHYDKALSYNKKALLISQSYIGKWSREECLNSIGSVYMETARYREALEYFKLALNYVRQIAHNREEARCYYNIGQAYLELDDLERAEEYFGRGRTEAESSGQRVVLGLCLVRLGDLARRQGDAAAAEDGYRSAARLGEEIGHPAIRWQAAAGQGALAAGRNRIADAVNHYLGAVAVIEDLRSLILEREHSAGFFQSKLGVYEDLMDLYAQLHASEPDAGYDRRCYEYAERARSRAFLDDLQAARIDPRTWPAPPEDRADILALSQTVSRTLTELSRSDIGRSERERLWESLEMTEEDLQAAVEAVRLERPDLARLMRCEPSGLDEIRRVVLGPGTVLLELFAGEHGVYVFYVSREKLKIHRLTGDAGRAIRELARNYAQLLASPRVTAPEAAAAGRGLYEQLIAPGRDVIGSDTRSLIIVPDREFCFVPFETLAVGTGARGLSEPDYLVRTWAITYAPSASALANILARKEPASRPKDLLAIGAPIVLPSGSSDGPEWDNPLEEFYREKRFELGALPFTRREIEGVSRFVRPERQDVLMGRSATEEMLARLRLADYRVLHFATHSLIDERVSHRSALVLSQDLDPAEDGFLQVREIYQSELDADLVVLSACQTARGKLEKGEGVQGLPRAFFCAGARAVLVSLWPVGDRSTARFMRHFYSHLADGRSLQESLRRTKLDLARRSAPLDWAGFVLLGDGQRRLELSRPSRLRSIISRIF